MWLSRMIVVYRINASLAVNYRAWVILLVNTRLAVDISEITIQYSDEAVAILATKDELN